MVCDNIPVSIIKATHFPVVKLLQGWHVQFVIKVLPCTLCLSSQFQRGLLVNSCNVIIARQQGVRGRAWAGCWQLRNVNKEPVGTAEIKGSSRAVMETFEPVHTEEQEDLSFWLLKCFRWQENMGIWAFMTASKLLWPWKEAPCGMTITVIRTHSICSDTALPQEQIFPFLLTNAQCSPSFIAQDSAHLIMSNWILTKPKISVLPYVLFITYCPSLRTEPPEFKGSANNH